MEYTLNSADIFDENLEELFKQELTSFNRASMPHCALLLSRLGVVKPFKRGLAMLGRYLFLYLCVKPGQCFL